MVPNGGVSKQGTVGADARVSLWCSGDPEPLTFAQLAMANSTNTKVAWDIKPWTLGFPVDESPDLSTIVAPLVTTEMDGCALVVTLVVTEATGTRGQNGARAFNSLAAVAGVPELHIDYEPPTTAEQLAWVSDASCAVQVSVPAAFTAADGGSCARTDVAAGKEAADNNA